MPDRQGAAGVLQLARELIGRHSVTPEDGGCQALIAERLARAGFRCEPMRFGQVSNLWARRGVARPLVCFAGHTDVVPTGPLAEWQSDPFVPTVREGRLYGRGAADMKSSVAAFVSAAEAFVAERPAHSGSIAFLLTSDEEGPALDGTARVVDVLKKRKETLDHCIVGEPTSVDALGDMVKIGRRGSLSGRLVVRGIQGHVAYPQLSRNPVHEMAPALAELAKTEWDAGTADFPPTTWQVSNVHAGTGAANVIPGSAQIDFNFRFSTAHTEASLKSRMDSVLQSHGLDYSIEWTLGARPFLTPRGTLLEVLSRAIHGTTGRAAEASTTGGTSDARFIVDICPQIVEFGPVNSSIHRIDEHIELDSLERLCVIYLDTLRALLP
jgi:succinyl-diaminopimelate desuccinylase